MSLYLQKEDALPTRFCYNENYSNILTLYTYEKNKEDTLAVIVSNILGEEIFRREEILENPDWRFFTDIVDKGNRKISSYKSFGNKYARTRNQRKNSYS